MTAIADVPGQGFPAPPEPDLTMASALTRAEAMVPALVARQAETEQRTYYSEQTHEEFAAAGFYRLLVPRRYGGYEFGVETFMRVVMTLARGCPSTAWMYCLGATHAVAAATLFGEQAQEEIFRGGDFIAPATIVPGGSATLTDDGDWIVSGTWGYCSGSPYATHFMAHTFVPGAPGEPPTPVLFVVPRDQWRRHDDWGGQLGLRGSGSHSVTVDNARIPDHFVLPGVHLSLSSVGDGTPGLALHGNPEFGGGPLSYMVLEMAALAVGIAQGALEAYADLMRTRTTVLPPIVGRAEDPDYQFWYAEAAGMIAAAEASVLGLIRQWHDLCVAGPAAFTREQDLRLAMICRHVVQQCWTAVESHLFPTAGSSAVCSGERFERIWRDLSMLRSHSGLMVFLPAKAGREYSRVHFGVGAGS
jgi:3-hydroxy-9,10-secoandrosta-1,3,5(10)-triene-9,17-dione monooxygenase